MTKKHIKSIESFVKKKMSGEVTGHDWYHVNRVRKLALLISKKEKNIDYILIESAALLHDIGDWKINDGKMSEEDILRDTCKALKISQEYEEKIVDIISNMSYSANLDRKRRLSLEGQIVQDADRLEALGAIGIARSFAYGGKKGREIYNPKIKPTTFSSTTSYRTASSPSINHFYEKLFLLRKELNTQYAKEIALKREKFMKDFLKEFYKEWDVKI